VESVSVAPSTSRQALLRDVSTDDLLGLELSSSEEEGEIIERRRNRIRLARAVCNLGQKKV